MKKSDRDKLQDLLMLEMSITLEIFCDMHNCDSGELERNGLNWYGLHKLNRRVKTFMSENKGN